MATQEQIAEAMNAMQRQIAELASQLAEERHRSANLDRVAQVLDRWTTQQAQQPVARLVDTRRIGRPSNFGSGEEKSLEKSFPVWQRKMQNYIISVFPDLREPLEWAATTAVPITHQLVEQRFGSEADPTDQVMDLEDKMHQVFAVLMQVTEGEANDIVCNSGGLGLEAWRKLTRRWNPLTGSRLRNLLRHVISPGRASLTELPGALERWEEQVSKYRNSKNQQGQSRDIPEDILMAALESLVPTDLEVHLQMNSSRFETYDAMRAEVLAFIESRTGSRMTETKVHKHDKIRDDPMDVDSVVKGKGKNKFSGSCYICGRVGHKSTECWSRDRVSNKGSGKTQNANVSSPGKGKSIGKGHSKGQGKGKGKWKSKDRKGFQSGGPADSLEFEEEPWEETNDAEQEQWWNSWVEDVEQDRNEAPLGALMVGGTEFELNSFKTASGEILPDEGQLMWPCFLQDGRKCWLRGHVTDVHKPLISAGKVLGKDKVAILHSSGGSIFSWNSSTGNLISRAMTKVTRQVRSDELIRLYREDNIYNFYVKGLDGRWQAQNFDTGAAVSVLPRSYAKPVQRLSGGSRQALSAKVDPKL